MEVKVVDFNGKDTGRKVQLSDSVFAIEPNNHAVYLDVKQYLANQRQGNHKAKVACLRARIAVTRCSLGCLYKFRLKSVSEY